jgi:tetrahydromethanopterin S-methyltransferase subunit C
MIMMVACAVIGAVLGLYAKPRWLGVLVALTLMAAIEGGERLFIGLIQQQPNRELLIAHLQAIFGETWFDALAPTAAALIGSVLAAVMGKVMDRDTQKTVFDVDSIRRKAGKDGRYARLNGMVEERQIHAKAESRIDSILGL